MIKFFVLLVFLLFSVGRADAVCGSGYIKKCGVCVQSLGFGASFASECVSDMSTPYNLCVTYNQVHNCGVEGVPGYNQCPYIRFGSSSAGGGDYCYTGNYQPDLSRTWRYYNYAPSGGGGFDCPGLPPTCSSPFTLVPPCDCGCSNYSTDVCRVHPDSASTCNYSCPLGASLEYDGHCYKNGVRCRESFCPDECNITPPTCTAGDCEISCNSQGCLPGYTFILNTCLCQKDGTEFEYYKDGVHYRPSGASEIRTRFYGRGGYEKRIP